MHRDSLLLARFSVAQYAHVAAVRLEDWTALVDESTKDGELRASFAVPSARAANGTLIVLNGWGFGENLSADGTRLTHRVGHRGHKYVFDDPLPWLFSRLHGSHAVNYGNDHSISAALLERFYHTRLGRSLARYSAPNLDGTASRLPYALQAPLGLNSNGRELGELLRAAAAAQHTSFAHRSPEMLCCCMSPRRSRGRVMRTLEHNGFRCSNGTRPWRETMALYLQHRFVLAVFGNGHNDFRYWEALSAGAVPVVQHFDEHDGMFDGLPVVRVRDWGALTPASLEAEWARIQEGVRLGTLSWTKIFLPYWLHQHTAHLQPRR